MSEQAKLTLSKNKFDKREEKSDMKEERFGHH